MRKNYFIAILAIFSLFSCSIEEQDKFGPEITNGIDGQDGNDGQDGLDGTSIDFWDNPDGSTTFIIYLDEGKENRNFKYDVGEQWFNQKTFYPPVDGQDGEDGQDGTSFVILQEVFTDLDGRECVRITTFHDADGDREYNENVDELETETEVCSGLDGENGTDGQDGTDGTNGEDGISVVVTTREATENECANGGIVTSLSYSDGEFIGEYATCNGNNGQDGEDGTDGTNGENGTDGQNGSDGQDGQDGSDGTSSMIVSELIAEGEYGCEHGGLKIVIMNDKNADGDFEDDGEVTVEILCNLKCVYEEVCIDVYDTINCGNGLVYVMWIDGTYFYNIDLTFEQFNDGTALLYGKVNKHNSTKVFLVDVTYSDIVVENTKDHNCLTVDPSEWVQYATMTGTIKAVDGGISYTLTRRGEPFQLGVGANSTSNENVFGGSGWFVTDGHNQCIGDFNFNICR